MASNNKKIKTFDGRIAEILEDVPGSILNYNRLLNGRAPVALELNGLTKGQSDILNFILPSGSDIVFSDGKLNITIPSIITEFIFRPGGIPSGNIYTDFLALITGHDLVDGPSVIYFDDSLGSLVIPTGTYDFSNTVLARFKTPDYPSMGGLTVSVDLSDGVVFSNNRITVEGLKLKSLSTAPIITFAGTGIVILREGAELEAAGTFSFIRQTVASIPARIFIDKGKLVSGSEHVIHTDIAEAEFDIYLFNEASVEDGVFSSTDVLDVIRVHLKSPSASCSFTQPEFAGSLTKTLENFADTMFYDKTIIGTLSAEDVQGAIDELLGLIGGGDIVPEKTTFAIGSDGQTAFVIPFTPNLISNFFLSVNGIGTEEGVSYTISGTDLTWLDSPYTLETTDRLTLHYFK